MKIYGTNIFSEKMRRQAKFEKLQLNLFFHFVLLDSASNIKAAHRK